MAPAGVLKDCIFLSSFVISRAIKNRPIVELTVNIHEFIVTLPRVNFSLEMSVNFGRPQLHTYTKACKYGVSHGTTQLKAYLFKQLSKSRFRNYPAFG